MNCCRFGNGQGSIFRKSDGKYGKNILRLLPKCFLLLSFTQLTRVSPNEVIQRQFVLNQLCKDSFLCRRPLTQNPVQPQDFG